MWSLAVYERADRQTPIAVLPDIPAALPPAGARLTLAGIADKFTVVEYAIRGDAGAQRGEIAVVVEREVPHWFERLTDDARLWVTATLVSLTVVLSAVIGLYAVYEPQLFRAFLGYYARPVVGFGLFLLGALAPLRLPGWTRGKPTLVGWYVGLLSPVIGIVLAIAWAQLSLPDPAPAAWPDDYARYFDALTARIDTVIPVIAGVVPIAVVLLKTVGLEMIGKGVAGAVGWAKDHRSH